MIGGDLLVDCELLNAVIEGASIVERESVMFEIGIVSGVRVLLAIDIRGLMAG